MKDPLWAKLVVWLFFIGIILSFFLVLNLPKLWAYDWDLKCLFADCRKVK